MIYDYNAKKGLESPSPFPALIQSDLGVLSRNRCPLLGKP